MKIAVCIKQVPSFSEGRMDPETGVIIRDGLEAVINPNDLPAIETAMRIKEIAGGAVDVFTMGPQKAEGVLRDAYGMGADRGYLICDRKFSGADVLATAYTLAQGMNSVDQYDLVICGKETSDGGTAQVGGSIAQWMDIPDAAFVSEIVKVEQDCIVVRQDMDGMVVTLQMNYPCLLSVAPSIYIPRMQSLNLKIAAKKKPVHKLGLSQLQDQEEYNYGLKGSATRVERIYPVEKKLRQDIIDYQGRETGDLLYKTIKQIVS